MTKLVQRATLCRCGSAKILAHGLCATCYTLKRQDIEHFGGLREQVLERDGYQCRVCAELAEIDRLCIGQPPSVHHRVPGVSLLHLMITLCAAHHAQVERTQMAMKQIGIERFGAHDLRRTCAKLCRKNGGELEQIKFLLGHSSIQTTERYLRSEQEIAVAVNDGLGF